MRVKKQSEPGRGAALSVGLCRYLYATAAVTGAGILILEILGAKLLAPYVGTSHFVWTAQIVVTLVALAGGYGLGGWLVDRWPRPGWLYGSILLAGAYLCGTVLLNEPVAYFCLRFPLPLGSLLASALLFFVPLALLAMVGPFVVRLVTNSVSRVGGTMGRLTAISTLGSVAGAVLVGYVLLPFLPNSMTLYLTAGGLMAVAAGYFAGWGRRGLGPALAGLVLAGSVGFVGTWRTPGLGSFPMRELFRGNSNFGLLRVVETMRGDRRYYLNDFLTQDTYDPIQGRSDSLFTYMLEGLARGYTPALHDALCIGLGVGIVPRELAHQGIRVEAVEINPAVVPLARRFFGFDPRQVHLVIGDGREYLHQTRRHYDTIVVDAFLGESPPSHLMTREAMRDLQHHLNAGGTLVMNTFGSFTPGRDFFCASVEKTLHAVFRSVRVHAGGNGNVFFVASDQPELRLRHPLDFDRLPSELRELARLTVDGVMQTDPSHGLILTDDYNPVDYYDAANREELRRRLALAYQPE